MSPENYFETLPSNLGVIIHTSIIRDNRPILVVAHDTDGEWSFMDGGVVLSTNLSMVALREILELDPSLQELGTLPRGHYAERTDRHTPWSIQALDDLE
ncbi:MAG: hypothetical protein JNL67_22770 [Planctomycetaceae bacterium]|nr:hypothetical protein [Planctomycetaceae bacterium]